MNRFCARLLIVLLAGVLQFHQLGRDIRFHPDEARFMPYARRGARNGDWLVPGALDKPPLSIYRGALSMVAAGLVADDMGVERLDPLAGEFAARLPNVIMAILLVALMIISQYSCNLLKNILKFRIVNAVNLIVFGR